MRNIRLKSALRTAGVMLTSGALLSIGTFTTSHVAGADPSYPNAYVGVGSDTIQDVFSAYTGQANAVSFAPLTSTSGRTVASWDATPAGTCITPKPGGQIMLRPSGSGAGINALREAAGLDTTPSTNFICPGNSAPTLTGQVDFARSSRGPSDTSNTDLTWIPFARDGVDFAYFDHSTNAIATLTLAQIQSAYSNTVSGTVTVGSETVKACLPNALSGTTAFWITAVGVSSTTMTAAATAAGCNNAFEENDGNAFTAFGAGLPAGTDAIIPFSCASWIAQANGTGLDRSNNARGVIDMGQIDSRPKCYTPSTAQPPSPPTPPLSPNATFYGDTTFGRNVYIVAKTSRVGIPGDGPLKDLFVGTTSKICSTPGQLTADKLGFLSLSSGCGSTTLKGKK